MTLLPMPKRNPTVYLVRHGETALNVGKEKLRGWADVPLNRNGREQAKKVAAQLADKGIKKIYSSDLSRAMVTAKAIAKAAKTGPIIPVKGLRPWDVGKYTGKETKTAVPALEKYVEKPSKKVPGGESLNSFTGRFDAKLKSAMDEAEKTGKPIALVAHYRNLREALSLLGHKRKDFLLKKGPEGTASVLKISKSGNLWKGRLTSK